MLRSTNALRNSVLGGAYTPRNTFADRMADGYRRVLANLRCVLHAMFNFAHFLQCFEGQVLRAMFNGMNALRKLMSGGTTERHATLRRQLGYLPARGKAGTQIHDVVAVMVDHAPMRTIPCFAFRADDRVTEGLAIRHEVVDGVSAEIDSLHRISGAQWTATVAIAGFAQRVDILLGGINVHFTEMRAGGTNYVTCSDMVDDLIPAGGNARSKLAAP